MRITEAIAAVSAQKNLEEEEACRVMEEIMAGSATDAQIAGLLIALRMKGEHETELTGFARAMRAGATAVQVAAGGLVDTCGTGGDGTGTFNISTAAAFVVAACGIPVAKHGNRGISSRCGSADVLEALGACLDLTPEAAASAVDQTGFGFFFAPLFHGSMRHAVRARKEIGIRTIFNLLGPLANPAGADYQLLGVCEPGLTGVLGRVLRRLGVKAAMVVSGAGGLDEISTLGPTTVTEVKRDQINTYRITPGMFGLPAATLKSLQGGDKHRNAAIIRRILEGEPGPPQDIVIINAAAALYIAGKTAGIAEGIGPAREAICSGAALRSLDNYLHFTQKAAGKEAAGSFTSSA